MVKYFFFHLTKKLTTIPLTFLQLVLIFGTLFINTPQISAHALPFTYGRYFVQLSTSIKNREADIIIYGGTSAAIVAAVQAIRMGKSVIVVSPDLHLGGLSSGGLGFTDTGNKKVIGGLSREFYQRIYNHYQKIFFFL